MTKIKICGVKDPRIASEAIKLGVHYIGIVFDKDSKRYVEPMQAKKIAEATISAGGISVGVFTDQTADQIQSICEQAKIMIAQLHSKNAIRESSELNIKTISVITLAVNGNALNKVENDSMVLFDREKEKTKDPINTKYIKKMEMTGEYFIGGGLSPENVAEIVTECKPYGVDVSSGVENDSGDKCLHLIKQLIDSVNKSKTRYGDFGGIYMPELLMPAIHKLAETFEALKNDENFNTEFNGELSKYAGRPTPLTEVNRFRQAVNGPRLFLKREDLLHTGAHKINNALGQCLLAKLTYEKADILANSNDSISANRLNNCRKPRIIAETGAGQHGVATATACARFGLDCTIYMGANDIKRQAPNVEKMKLLGAKVIPVTTGTQTLKDAVNAALRDWAESFETTHYCLGSALGPYPYPQMVAYFQSIIGIECKDQCQEAFGATPNKIIACVGGGSNAIGIFSAFINDDVGLIGVEAGGKSLKNNMHAARFYSGRKGVLHGCESYVLQDEHGQIAQTHSIAAGLDYPMVGPQHANLFESGRAQYSSSSDEEALSAFELLATNEGIIPALESSHALAYYIKNAEKFDKDCVVVINLSGRGDKDLPAFFLGKAPSLRGA